MQDIEDEIAGLIGPTDKELQLILSFSEAEQLAIELARRSNHYSVVYNQFNFAGTVVARSYIELWNLEQIKPFDTSGGIYVEAIYNETGRRIYKDA